MKAIIFAGSGRPLTVQERPIPVPLDDELTVRVQRSGICASDVRLAQTGAGMVAGESTLGHEYVGQVVAVGDHVTGIPVGSRVASMAFGGCGRCAFCRAGRIAHCPERRPFRNAFAQYAVTTQSACRVVPDRITDDAAALTEPVAVAVHALSRAGQPERQRILVLGAGPVGLLVGLLARRRRSQVALVARSRRRAAQADALGMPLLVRAPGLQAQVAEALGGAPAVVVDCAGAIDDAVGHAAPDGCVVVVAVEREPSPLHGYAALRKQVDLRFSLAYDSAAFDTAVSLLDDIHEQLRVLVTRTVGLAEFPAAFAEVAAGGRDCKVLLDPWR